MSDVLAFPSLARPRPLTVNTCDRGRDPVVVWPVGPDPESLRAVSRDLTAVRLRLLALGRELDAEIDAVAHLTDPEIRGLHVDRTREAILRARCELDRLDGLLATAPQDAA